MSPMPVSTTAKLADGNEIFFTDSGAVPNSDDYTTIVIFHGSAFNSAGCYKLHEFAAKNNFRTILVNRKDYQGSTKYTDSELDDLRNGRKVFLDRIGVLVAHLLQYFVEEHNIPKVSEDRKSGGFAVVGWSMGSSTVMALFSDPTIIPKDTYALIEPYVRDLVLYDPPYLCFGYKLPEVESYDPWTDPDCKTLEDRYAAFNTWVGSYFDVPDDWAGDITKLDMRKRPGRSTVDDWTPEEKDAWFEAMVGVRSEFPMYMKPMQAAIKEMTHQVLYDDKTISSLFPQARLIHISCLRSNWHCVWAGYETERLYKEYMKEGHKIRPSVFVTMKNGNHFAHYDIPEELLQTIDSALRGST